MKPAVAGLNGERSTPKAQRSTRQSAIETLAVERWTLDVVDFRY